MRLTLDVTPMLVRSAGVKNMIYYWSHALEATRNGREIQYFPFIDEMGGLNHDKGLGGSIPDWRLFVVAALNLPGARPVTRLLLRKTEIFHCSPQMRFAPRTARLTSHIHDMTCWLMPELHTRANVTGALQIARHVWRKADGLIAVSHSAKNDAARIAGIDPERIEVIYSGVPERFFSVSPREREQARAKYGLAKPYCLSLGTVEPRKNLDRLLDAWYRLPADIKEAFDLVVAGPAGWKSETILARFRFGKPGVRYLGYVPESDLPGLTGGAVALLYPSLYEGFGFPLAQAMACGLPSVTSNISSMPEVAAGSAVLVDPLSVDGIRDAIACLLTSPGTRERLGAAGRERALAHYRWDITARQSWSFFERIAG